MSEGVKKALLVYYTFDGNTGFVADFIKEKFGGIDTEQLKPAKEPPKEGFGKFLIGGKSALFREEPELSPLEADVNDYGNIILAFPIWAGTFPPAMGSFLKNYPFEGKKVYVIACSGGGNADKAFEQIRKKTAGNTVTGTLSLVSPLRNQEDAKKQIVGFLESAPEISGNE